MDVELARTFLAVVETGSFLAAAERVHVTQSTVSTRIKSLEDQLRRPLFTRSKTGAELTTAGRHFHRHAQTILRSWTQARLDVGLPEHLEAVIDIGAQHSLWDGYLSTALGALHLAFPELAFKASMADSKTLMGEMVQGTLDLAVMYRPEVRAGFALERLFEDEFVLVTSHPDSAEDPFGQGYVYIDWGPDFRADHVRCFPAIETPAVQLGIGTLGLQYLQAYPASGYFPSRLIKQDTTLRIVREAPSFSYSAFAIFQDDADSDKIARLVRVLKARAEDMARGE